MSDKKSPRPKSSPPPAQVSTKKPAPSSKSPPPDSSVTDVSGHTNENLEPSRASSNFKARQGHVVVTGHQPSLDADPNVKQKIHGEGEAKAENATVEVKGEIFHNPNKITQQIHKDSPAGEDTLGYKPIVDALARMILHKKTLKPITIGIHGEWGTGKSSILLQLENELDRLVNSSSIDYSHSSRKRVLHVKFDAWLHDVNSNMLGVFLQEIVNKIEKKQSLYNVIKDRLLVAVKRISRPSWLYFSILLISFCILCYFFTPSFESLDKNWLSTIPLVALFLGKSMRETIGKIASPLGVNINSIIKGNDYEAEVDGIHDFKTTLSQILSEKLTDYGVMVVYVDDLDRCEPKSVIAVIETINKFLDIDKCCFVLGVAKERTAKLINKYYGYEDDDKYGSEFLHKMIQLPINMPQMPTETIYSYVFDLHGLPTNYSSTQNEDDQQLSNENNLGSDFEYSDLKVPERLIHELAKISQYLIPSTPRNIKRFQNKFLYYFLLANIWSEYTDHIDVELLPVWLLLRERYPNEIKFIVINEGLTWESLYSDHESDFKNMRALLRDIVKNVTYNNTSDSEDNILKKYISSDKFIKSYIGITGWI